MILLPQPLELLGLVVSMHYHAQPEVFLLNGIILIWLKFPDSFSPVTTRAVSVIPLGPCEVIRLFSNLPKGREAL